ncbi:hypothetical protein N7454_001577 [Penicillium verhagenii]|nr:hypothetical protein N7454_001577 [Penicillium verhagenii]
MGLFQAGFQIQQKQASDAELESRANKAAERENEIRRPGKQVAITDEAWRDLVKRFNQGPQLLRLFKEDCRVRNKAIAWQLFEFFKDCYKLSEEESVKARELSVLGRLSKNLSKDLICYCFQNDGKYLKTGHDVNTPFATENIIRKEFGFEMDRQDYFAIEEAWYDKKKLSDITRDLLKADLEEVSQYGSVHTILADVSGFSDGSTSDEILKSISSASQEAYDTIFKKQGLLYEAFYQDGKKFDQEGYNKAYFQESKKFLTYFHQHLSESDLTPEIITALKETLDEDKARICRDMWQDKEWSDGKENLQLEKEILTVLVNDAKVLRAITRAILIAWTECNVAVDLSRKNLDDYWSADFAIKPKHDRKKAYEENKDILEIPEAGEDFELFNAKFDPIPADFIPKECEDEGEDW